MLSMTTITVDTFWNLENRNIIIEWITLTLFLLIEADLKSYPAPNVHEVKVKLRISDGQLASYILEWTQGFFHKLLRLTGSSEGVLKELAIPTKKAISTGKETSDPFRYSSMIIPWKIKPGNTRRH
jgi:hypothetical protein